MNRQHVYLISGLGSDERVFQYLDLSAYTVHPIAWIPPQKEESLQHYAQRLAEKVKHPEPILIGLSMGGMIAVEIGKYIPVQKVILISSAAQASELPKRYQLIRICNIYRYLPDRLLTTSHQLLYYMFGVRKPEHRAILKSILQDTDPHFVRWAIAAILKWNNQTVGNNIIRIHGVKDRIIPVPPIRPDYILHGAGHSMIFQYPEILSEYIKECI